MASTPDRTVVEIGVDDIGVLAHTTDEPNFLYYLTPCCKASAKGSYDGVVCRACTNSSTQHSGWRGRATNTTPPTPCARTASDCSPPARQARSRRNLESARQ